MRLGGVGRRCRHGFPQAFAFDVPDTWNSNGAVNSGLCRLSCPLLVRAVDEREAQAGVKKMNAELAERTEWRAAFRATNSAVAAMRRELLAMDAGAYAAAMSSDKAAQWSRTLDSGLAGVTPSKDGDVKCIHALLSDYLCRADAVRAEGRAEAEAGAGAGGSSGSSGSSGDPSLALGETVLARLRAEGVEVDGSATCHEQCDPHSNAEVYVPVKNKQKLWMRRQRRLEQKREKRAKDDALLLAGQVQGQEQGQEQAGVPAGKCERS